MQPACTTRLVPRAIASISPVCLQGPISAVRLRARGVALAAELGTGLFRGSVDWAKLLRTLPARCTSRPTTPRFSAAAVQASQRGAIFEVQVGAGGPVEHVLVANGTWGARVNQLVAHFKGTVGAWEAWNEPNNNFGAASKYVSSVLVPFAGAVHQADPKALVVGASTLGVDLNYLEAIGASGGFAAMDVVAIHPYTGHNRSWEEQGTPRAIQSLHTLLAKYGADRKPIWDTEGAWWSDGPANFYSQADKAAASRAVDAGARGEPLELLHDRRWLWRLWPVVLAHSKRCRRRQLRETCCPRVDDCRRQYRGPSCHRNGSNGSAARYALELGLRAGGSDHTLALWSDDLQEQVLVNASANATGIVIDEYGATSPVTLRAGSPLAMPIDGSPRYLTVGAGVKLTLSPGGLRTRCGSGRDWSPGQRFIQSADEPSGEGERRNLRCKRQWRSAGRPCMGVCRR